MVTQQMYADAPPMTWVDAAGEKHTMQLTDWMWDMVGGFALVICVFLVLGTTLPVERIYLYGTIVGITVVVFMISCSIVGGIQVKRYCLEWVKQNDHSGQY
ncbi:hypothetical protein BCR43DRAFT_488680 [Syncephalastrum racemosum]|uniref:Uncharacterized protein n=1 Tax=Syncephalastrum racemosum TaxID=13706 RepID=A0A1X2HJ06_SYNRA|nr:hypothetical protein BCR43DRAFT_488680 [Syncephalastrum racemosum]